MQTNRVRQIWQAGKVATNGWLHIPSAFSAESLARAGYDSLTVDMQHGLADYQTTIAILQALAATPVVPFVRPPWNDPGLIMRLLDGGAFGIICPLINNRAEAEAFVQACRYPPRGFRSYGPVRAGLIAGDDYPARAADLVITLAMIETAEGLAHVEEIAATPGLDGLYIGPADLSISLGLPKRADLHDPTLLAAIDRVVAAAQQQQLATGIFVGHPQDARRMVQRGVQLVTISADVRLLVSAAQESLATFSKL